MSNVGYCLNFWWPHRKTSNKTLKHKKIALRFRDRKLLNTIHLVPKSPAWIFTSILAYYFKLTENMHENISIVQPFSCSSAENRSKNTPGCCARSRARARTHPRSLTHAALRIIMWYWGLLSHACDTSSSIFVG